MVATPRNSRHRPRRCARRGFRWRRRRVDETDGAATTRAVERIEAECAPIDILVNNAGIHRRAPLAEMTEEQWRTVIDTNLTSAFLVARATVPRMIMRGAGKIINVCSVMAEVSRPTIANYSAAKGGLKMLTAPGGRLAKHGIQATRCAGYFVTELKPRARGNAEFNQWNRPHALGRWASRRTAASCVPRLARERLRQLPDVAVDAGLLAAL